MNNVNYDDFDDEKVIRVYRKTYRMVLFITIIWTSLFAAFFVYSLISLVLDAVNEAKVMAIISRTGDMFTGMMAMAFSLVFLIISGIYLRKKDDKVISFGYKKERKIGVSGMAMFVAGVFFLAYAIASFVSLLDAFNFISLLIGIIGTILAFASFYIGRRLLKLSALMYNYSLPKKEEEKQ